MRGPTFVKATTFVVTTLVMMLTAAAQVPEPEEEVDPRILEYDKGPDTIDVSGYPAEVQATYDLFLEKCGKCHTPARPINCDFALEDEWGRYIKRMMRRSGKFITPDDAKQIYVFLTYDSKTRKKDMYERKLKEGAKPSGQ